LIELQTILLIIQCELAHFVFGFFSALVAGSLVYLSMRIIFRSGSLALGRTSSRSTFLNSIPAAGCILIFSLSASAVLHVLEDFFLSWF